MHETPSQARPPGPPGTAAGDSLTDAQLLQRFARQRDQSAFAALVHRHGRLVLGVCRRVLRSAEDAEDAFQATFLVLARRAGSIREPHLLANWLYGVASRIARKARATVSQRQMHEKPSRLPPDLAAPAPADPALDPVLDDELARLPEKYRAAVVLCYLQGRTNEEAAALLRWPVGTVKGRLAKARQLLRQRLLRRGFRTSCAVLAAFLLAARARAGSVPAPLRQATARAGAEFAAGRTGAALSPRAVRLAEAVLRAPEYAPLLGVALLLALLVAGAAGRWLNPSADSSPRPGAAPPCHLCGAAAGPERPAAR